MPRCEAQIVILLVEQVETYLESIGRMAFCFYYPFLQVLKGSTKNPKNIP
mgnify:CR=1 FL=1